ncbi:hypothetical protein H112_01457 [Trichophyton rubrum D6]|uniref:Uncharacterized protein n=2 Tax=Trichophyton TaxID=5550 RepID=A0A022WCI7_TRIRU|nr:hypothetical protein H100_01452 [Trichophyton rubrum MR850]EZF45417.1 hypothetical protein H102_01447 [Trichophyton rubrum CBS 100081]EZF56077.1 hypothetical protein H103_01459 [Trichophyton rubrum CBS 288.86]EZF66689.1 hypothetical protein H104_01437 [Trichophyton rubrum CBS 289.86]EZF77467.1 hypothetical protein H105_01466 [Trichophyton soudanense CBS 452.61]EZF87978.1 hypothetical protein H110_01457 [Trichophyton rubrum MR1448]EZG20313.1 hypothetical protein H107_01507 [Trichophyton rub
MKLMFSSSGFWANAKSNRRDNSSLLRPRWRNTAHRVMVTAPRPFSLHTGVHSSRLHLVGSLRGAFGARLETESQISTNRQRAVSPLPFQQHSQRPLPQLLSSILDPIGLGQHPRRYFWPQNGSCFSSFSTSMFFPVRSLAHTPAISCWAIYQRLRQRRQKLLFQTR